MGKDSKKRLFEIMNKVNPELALKEEIQQGISNPTRLNAPIRSKINREISSLPNYFNEIPINTIEDILEKYGLVILQEDHTAYQGMFLGAEGRAQIELGYIETANKSDDGEVTFYTPIENAALILTWYKMQSGKYEIVSYVS